MIRLAQRLQRLEARWRPAVIAAILQRVRQCAPADLQACLLAELTAVDRATALAIIEQLTDVEFDALMGPNAVRLLETLPQSELDALARGDPVVTQRVQRALRSVPHEGDVCP